MMTFQVRIPKGCHSKKSLGMNGEWRDFQRVSQSLILDCDDSAEPESYKTLAGEKKYQSLVCTMQNMDYDDFLSLNPKGVFYPSDKPLGMNGAYREISIFCVLCTPWYVDMMIAWVFCPSQFSCWAILIPFSLCLLKRRLQLKVESSMRWIVRNVDSGSYNFTILSWILGLMFCDLQSFLYSLSPSKMLSEGFQKKFEFLDFGLNVLWSSVSPLLSNLKLFIFLKAAFWSVSKEVEFWRPQYYGSLSSTSSTIFLKFWRLAWSLGTFWWLECCILICS